MAIRLPQFAFSVRAISIEHFCCQVIIYISFRRLNLIGPVSHEADRTLGSPCQFLKGISGRSCNRCKRGWTGPQHQRLVRGVAPKHRGVLVGTVCAVQSATASFALKLASGAVNVPLRPGGERGDVRPDHHRLAMHKRCGSCLPHLQE